MVYRLKPLQGDTIAVPQLVFARLGAADECNVRVALYLLATGVTDPAAICADLKLRSRRTAENALEFWAGAGLLERCAETAEPAVAASPAPLTWAEIAEESRKDPMIASLIDCAQRAFGSALSHREMEKLVSLYMQEGYHPEAIMLCMGYVAGKARAEGKARPTLGQLAHELRVWRSEGVESGEQADAHLQLLELRAQREQYVAGLLQLPADALTLGGRKAIARWYESYGYDDAMIREVALQAGPRRDVWYWNSILKAWQAKGVRTLADVRGGGVGRSVRVDRATPSHNDFLQPAQPQQDTGEYTWRLKRKEED